MAQDFQAITTRREDAQGFLEGGDFPRPRMGAEIFAFLVSLRDGLLRHGVHVALGRLVTISPASARSFRASRRARPIC